MAARLRKRGFTLVELLVVIGIIAILVVVWLSAINAKGVARRAQCMNNMKQIVLAIHCYNSAKGRLPPSSQTFGNQTNSAHGWSFLTLILPYLDMPALYNTLQLDVDPDAPSSNPKAVAAAMAASSMPMPFICPSNSRPNSYKDKNGAVRYVSNCKAMGATHYESLQVAVGGTSPLYPNPLPTGSKLKSIHPDGAMFPAAEGLRLGDLTDGSSHTFLLAESVDTNASSWIRGEETTVYGLPTAGGCSGGTGVNACSGKITAITKPTIHGVAADYYAPAGFTGIVEDKSLNTVATWNTGAAPFRTFLAFDFTPGVGADAGCFRLPWNAGSPYSQTSVQYGPGSAHVNVVMHAMGDGSVWAISKNCDPAVYMFLITRSGNDPAEAPSQ